MSTSKSQQIQIMLDFICCQKLWLYVRFQLLLRLRFSALFSSLFSITFSSNAFSFLPSLATFSSFALIFSLAYSFVASLSSVIFSYSFKSFLLSIFYGKTITSEISFFSTFLFLILDHIFLFSIFVIPSLAAFSSFAFMSIYFTLLYSLKQPNHDLQMRKVNR